MISSVTAYVTLGTSHTFQSVPWKQPTEDVIETVECEDSLMVSEVEHKSQGEDVLRSRMEKTHSYEPV